MAAPLSKILRPVFAGFQATSKSVVEPRVKWLSVDPTSAPIRWGDPFKQIAGGTIIRCVPGDTSLLGIAAAGQNSVMPSSIATMPLPTDAAGNPLMPGYLADALTIFRGQCATTPGQAHLYQTHDLQYAIPDASAPTPTITNGGSAGSTTYTYKITAINANGETLVGTQGQTTTGNATLSATNYNIVTIPAVAGATAFGVYRAGTSLIAVVPAAATGSTVLNDTGLAILSTVLPTVNLTGWLINLAGTSTNVVQVRELDTTPQVPLGATASNAVLFTIPAAKSQIGNLSGS